MSNADTDVLVARMRRNQADRERYQRSLQIWKGAPPAMAGKGVTSGVPVAGSMGNIGAYRRQGIYQTTGLQPRAQMNTQLQRWAAGNYVSGGRMNYSLFQPQRRITGVIPRVATGGPIPVGVRVRPTGAPGEARFQYWVDYMETRADNKPRFFQLLKRATNLTAAEQQMLLSRGSHLAYKAYAMEMGGFSGPMSEVHKKTFKLGGSRNMLEAAGWTDSQTFDANITKMHLASDYFGTRAIREGLMSGWGSAVLFDMSEFNPMLQDMATALGVAQDTFLTHSRMFAEESGGLLQQRILAYINGDTQGMNIAPNRGLYGYLKSTGSLTRVLKRSWGNAITPVNSPKPHPLANLTGDLEIGIMNPRVDVIGDLLYSGDYYGFMQVGQTHKETLDGSLVYTYDKPEYIQAIVHGQAGMGRGFNPRGYPALRGLYSRTIGRGANVTPAYGPMPARPFIMHAFRTIQGNLQDSFGVYMNRVMDDAKWVMKAFPPMEKSDTEATRKARVKHVIDRYSEMPTIGFHQIGKNSATFAMAESVHFRAYQGDYSSSSSTGFTGANKIPAGAWENLRRRQLQDRIDYLSKRTGGPLIWRGHTFKNKKRQTHEVWALPDKRDLWYAARARRNPKLMEDAAMADKLDREFFYTYAQVLRSEAEFLSFLSKNPSPLVIYGDRMSSTMEQSLWNTSNQYVRLIKQMLGSAEGAGGLFGARGGLGSAATPTFLGPRPDPKASAYRGIGTGGYSGLGGGAGYSGLGGGGGYAGLGGGKDFSTLMNAAQTRSRIRGFALSGTMKAFLGSTKMGGFAAIPDAPRNMPGHRLGKARKLRSGALWR